MPFCTNCGAQTGDHDLFCGLCGARQPSLGAPAGHRPAGEGISPRTASMLCYVPWIGWIAAILVLASQRFRDSATVRFHAFQGLYLFVAWLLVDWAFLPWLHFGPTRIFPLGHMLHLFLLGVSIFMLVKTAHEERYSLPLVGELAERSL